MPVPPRPMCPNLIPSYAGTTSTHVPPGGCRPESLCNRLLSIYLGLLKTDGGHSNAKLNIGVVMSLSGGHPKGRPFGLVLRIDDGLPLGKVFGAADGVTSPDPTLLIIHRFPVLGHRPGVGPGNNHA